MRMSEKCRNNNKHNNINSDNPLASRRTDGGEHYNIELTYIYVSRWTISHLSQLYMYSYIVHS